MNETNTRVFTIYRISDKHMYSIIQLNSGNKFLEHAM